MFTHTFFMKIISIAVRHLDAILNYCNWLFFVLPVQIIERNYRNIGPVFHQSTKIISAVCPTSFRITLLAKKFIGNVTRHGWWVTHHRNTLLMENTITLWAHQVTQTSVLGLDLPAITFVLGCRNWETFFYVFVPATGSFALQVVFCTKGLARTWQRPLCTYWPLRGFMFEGRMSGTRLEIV